MYLFLEDLVGALRVGGGTSRRRRGRYDDVKVCGVAVEEAAEGPQGVAGGLLLLLGSLVPVVVLVVVVRVVLVVVAAVVLVVVVVLILVLVSRKKEVVVVAAKNRKLLPDRGCQKNILKSIYANSRLKISHFPPP